MHMKWRGSDSRKYSCQGFPYLGKQAKTSTVFNVTAPFQEMSEEKL